MRESLLTSAYSKSVKQDFCPFWTSGENRFHSLTWTGLQISAHWHPFLHKWSHWVMLTEAPHSCQVWVVSSRYLPDLPSVNNCSLAERIFAAELPIFNYETDANLCRHNPLNIFALHEVCAWADVSAATKLTVHVNLFGGSILKLGTEKHHNLLVNQINSLASTGCFALTELGFGEFPETLASMWSTSKSFKFGKVPADFSSLPCSLAYWPWYVAGIKLCSNLSDLALAWKDIFLTVRTM